MDSSYLKSLGSVMLHDGADHHLVTPASKAADITPRAGYQMPTVAVHQPGTAAVKTVDQPSMLQNGMAGMKTAGHPYEVTPMDYQPVQFVNPQLGTYAPSQHNLHNLSYLLNGG